MAGLSASEMVVGIGPPLGVVGEYKCQPSPSLAVSFNRTLPPGAAVAGSMDQDTGSTICAKALAVKNKNGRNLIHHPLLDGRTSVQFRSDFLGSLAFGEVLGHADCVLDGLCSGASI